MADNTFLGLQPYTEDDAYRFKGRTEELQELFRLIVRNDFTVCYAESGEGKTSLLNAGVFPLLRENMYFPIAITFTSDDYKVTPDNFDAIIDRCIKDSIAEYNEKNNGASVKYELCSTDFQGLGSQDKLQQELSKYSWWKLRNYKPQAMGLTFTPVFVFDQFEEVFNLPGSIVWTKKFFDWLEDVSSDSCPDEIATKVRDVIGDKAAFPTIKEEKGFKAVFSLRKEFIGELDYWGMQTHFIPALKDNRYCLKALTYEGAKKVMTQQERFNEDKVEQVLTHFVGQYSREPKRTIAENLPAIPALLLSVVCDSLEKDIAAFTKLSTDEIDQSLNKILEKFYDETIEVVIKDFTCQNKEAVTPESIRKDIDMAMFDLVDANGKRVRVKAVTTLGTISMDSGRRFSETLPIVKYKKILNKHRIIKITKIDEEDYVEIVHDCLCPIIVKRREKRLATEAKEREERLLREQTRKMRKRVSLFSLISIVAIGLVAVFLWQQRKATDAIEKTEAYREKSDSIQELKTIVENQYENLKRDSILLASHLKQILKDSVLLVSKNESLQQQIIVNQQKDKIIERLEALSQLKVNNLVPGKLSEQISPNLKYLATSISIAGQLDNEDFASLREIINDGSLKHVDLENASLTDGEVISDSVFYMCSRLRSVKLPNDMKCIGYRAFSGCSGLASVTIPSSVTSIGYTAFSGCSGLASITFPSSVTSIGSEAFSGCSGLASVTIPSSVTSIGYRAFSGCSGLTSITIPNSVTSIGDGAFSDCSGLTLVVVSKDNKTYDSRDNCKAIIETSTNSLIAGCKNSFVPSSVTSIGERAFSGCSGLTSVTIPNSVTSIGYRAFSGCSGLTSVTIPNSVTSIGNGAFSDCSGLTSINIPNSVTSIGEWTFSDCSGLTSITIPNSVTTIGERTFYGCSGLTSITIPNSVTSIGSEAFSDCSGLTSINISNSVTTIGERTFWGCSGLAAVTIPGSVTSIGEWAFSFCSGLTSINIPNSVTNIGESAFHGCSGLTSINIPNSVTSIGNEAFSGCRSLTSVTIPSSVMSIGYKVFDDCSGLTFITIVLTEPISSSQERERLVNQYKSQPWWNETWKIEFKVE